MACAQHDRSYCIRSDTTVHRSDRSYPPRYRPRGSRLRSAFFRTLERRLRRHSADALAARRVLLKNWNRAACQRRCDRHRTNCRLREKVPKPMVLGDTVSYYAIGAFFDLSNGKVRWAYETRQPRYSMGAAGIRIACEHNNLLLGSRLHAGTRSSVGS